MLNIDLHKVTLIKILKSIYTDPVLRTVLGFKGGTAAFLFYDLPRFSVDLDFDLLNPDKKEQVFKKLLKILPEFGEVRQSIEKQNTLFLLIIYEKGQKNLKIEISKRATLSSFEIKHYLGIPVLVAKREDMVAGKLAALLTRRKLASRDLFDLWFFLKNNWRINEEVIKNRLDFSLEEALKKAEEKVENVKNNQLLSGLGDLLNLKQKSWVKGHLKEDLLFNIKLYLQSIVE